MCCVFILMLSFTHSNFAFIFNLFIHPETWCDTNFLSFFLTFLQLHVPTFALWLEAPESWSSAQQLSSLCLYYQSNAYHAVQTQDIYIFHIFLTLKIKEIPWNWILTCLTSEFQPPTKTICFILVQFFFTLLLIKTLRALVKIQCSSQPPFVLKWSHRKCSHLLRVKLNNPPKPS